MAIITDITGREILDSRGNPTVECDVVLENKWIGRASVPSGASTGIHEALELRDKDIKRYNGKGVLKAVKNINEILKIKLINKNFDSIDKLDNFLIHEDGTENKSKLGANTTLALSLAFAKGLALLESKTFYSFISKDQNFILPVPMMNVVNGGSHADNNVDIQEFMIVPVGASNFADSLRYGCEIFHSLKSILKSKNLNTNVGDEGGFAPNINYANEIIEIIIQSVEKTGLKIGNDILLSLDIASTEFYKNGLYHMKSENKKMNSDEMIEYIKNLTNSYPIFSVEDGMAEDDWEGWANLTYELGKKIQLVGDDLFVTNINRLQKGIEEKSANSILIKLNQIGTLSETINAIKLAKDNNFTTIISHRSGETEDTTIADLSVGISAGQIKTGSLSRTDRISKYNQLLRIEEHLSDNSIFAGHKLRNN